MDVRRIGLSIAVAGMGLAFAAASGLGANASGTASGGVFRYSLMSDVEHLDPALAGEQVAWEIEYATCSMLLNYPDAPAPRGARLVPDGAAAMPTVSLDGRTYTFRVRNGRRFSDGTPITARNFAWALLRVLHPGMRSPAAVHYADIEGAREFTAGRAQDVRGLSVLAGNRLRIRLERRAPDLLARLAMPFACAVVSRLPIDPAGVRTPIAGSGPYYVAEWRPRSAIVLRRNRYYRGPRPRRLWEVRLDVFYSLNKSRIEGGPFDHGQVGLFDHEELAQQYGVRRSSPGRYFVNPGRTIWYLAFNHERELFGKPGGGPGAGLGNVRLKQAVNYAIDRRDLINALRGNAGSFTDQYLPPAVPHFRNEIIYPTRPNLRKARQLARGHTRGGVAVLITDARRSTGFAAGIVEKNLRKIGIRVKVAVFPRCLGCGPKPEIRGDAYDIWIGTLRTNTFDPLSYLSVLDGRTIGPDGNTNLAYFHSDEYNRKLDRAASLTGEARYRALAALDVDLAKNAAPLAAFAVENDRRFFSARVRGFFYHPVYGLDLAAISVR